MEARNICLKGCNVERKQKELSKLKTNHKIDTHEYGFVELKLSNKLRFIKIEQDWEPRYRKTMNFKLSFADT